jgi:molybdate transport system substrate-binding protein
MKTWLVFASVLLCSSQAFALSNITVMATGDLGLAVSRIARDYAKLHNVSVSTSFAGKQEQAVQISEGGAVDVLITPDVQWLDQLQSEGLVDIYSKIEFARGRLALVGNSASTLSMKLTGNFIAAPLVHAMGGEPGLYIGNPEYITEGKYAREALRSIGALYVLEPYTLYSKTTDEMIEQVTQHDAYGVFNYGQALLLENAKIIDVFPEKTHSPITYYAVVIAGDNMDEARTFMKYISSGLARNALLASGLSAGP